MQESGVVGRILSGDNSGVVPYHSDTRKVVLSVPASLLIWFRYTLIDKEYRWLELGRTDAGSW